MWIMVINWSQKERSSSPPSCKKGRIMFLCKLTDQVRDPGTSYLYIFNIRRNLGGQMTIGRVGVPKSLSGSFCRCCSDSATTRVF